MAKVTLLGIDIAKEIFQLHGINASGKVVIKKKLKRSDIVGLSTLRLCAAD